MVQEIIVFHAGSLSHVFQQMAMTFENQNPGVKVNLEGSGARLVARKVIDQKRPCDIVASADYEIIDSMLMPDYAKFNIHFARNKLVLYFTDQSRYANEINADNWFEILLRPTVKYGHTDMELDPTGYRARMCWQLAEKYYHKDGLYSALVENILPTNILTERETISSRLISGELDYFFGYESGARQNGYRFVKLPEAINFSSFKYAKYYQQAEIILSGKKPGTFMTLTGKPIIYGVTLVEKAPNREVAIQFIEFVLEAGMPFLQNSGLIPLSPPMISNSDLVHLPPQLRRFF
ncbi:Uncharacterized solute-binding protein Pmob_0379 [Candidatus Desulfosporosinus infrequens]|uniref:Uncharacterized solute-binding protein Pmob_0379 n=1 Tax=Candidatus Desulfosporosinus infrequens TaxID=2043169 RepID=A0A2U3JX30_9FIRM|nr:Uncharacterized solute-binding protein Pmob_0379 [Candidatus Desulfosporosinus infrequens]